MRRFLVYLCAILPFISCLTPDELTAQWILNNIKTNDEEISSSEDTVKFQEDDSMSNFNPFVQTAPNLSPSQGPNLNPNGGQGGPNLNPNGGQGGPNLNPNGGHRGPNLNPNGGQGGPNLNPNGGQGGPNLNPNGGHRGPNLNPNGGQGGPNLNPNGGQGGPNLNPNGGHRGPNLNPNGGQGGPNLNPSQVQTAPNLNPNGEGKRGPNLNPNGGQRGNTSRPIGGHKSPNLNPSGVRGNACITKDGFAGECVSYYLCNSYNNMLIDDGADIIDVRYNPKCPHYLLVCCGINDIDQEEKGSESSEDTTISSTYTPIPTNIPKKYPSASEPPMSAVPSYRPNIQAFSQDETTNKETFMITKYNVTVKETTTCGWSNIDISPYKPNRPGMRPVNITSSLYGEFPFMVAVLLDSNSSVWSPNDYIGGGTLIHYRVVLTVAHKFHDTTLKLKCRAGEYDTQTIVEQFPHQERNVVKIKKHPDFFRPSLYNDIALLFLESAFRELPSIGIACLSQSFPEKTDDCYSMGWGRQIHDLSAYALTLKKIPLPLVEASQCQKLLRKTRLGPFFELHQTLTCAGGEGSIDTCAGDGGSPLVCSVESSGLNKRFVVVGLVVYGIKCGKHGEPGVYANVPFLYDWIEKEMKNEQIQQNYKL